MSFCITDSVGFNFMAQPVRVERWFGATRQRPFRKISAITNLDCERELHNFGFSERTANDRMWNDDDDLIDNDVSRLEPSMASVARERVETAQ